MKIFVIILITIFISLSSKGQIEKRFSLSYLDSICLQSLEDGYTLVFTKIYSFGKSNSKQLIKFDSCGLINSKIYNTSLLLSVINDTTKVYIPVKGRTFRKWYKKNPIKDLPNSFKILIKSQRAEIKGQTNCLLTIEKIEKSN